MAAAKSYFPSLRTVANVTLLYPLAVIGLLYTEWLLSWSHLGRPPIAWEDDPSFMCGTGWLYFVVYLAILASPPLAWVAIVTNAAHSYERLTTAWGGLRAFVMIAVWLGAPIWVRSDPHGIMKWWMD